MDKSNLGKRKKSIKFKLLILPLILVFIAIAGIGSISSNFMKNSLYNQMREDGFMLGDQIAKQMELASISLETINEMLGDKISAAGRSIITNQANVNNQVLKQTAVDLGVDEIHWYNNQGEILYSTIEEYVGWTPSAGHPVEQFMLGNKDILIEDIRKDSESDNFLKYGYIRHTDGTFVQVGILANTVENMSQRFSIQRFVEDLAENEDIVYALFMDKSLKTIAHNNKDEIGIVFDDIGSKTVVEEGTPYSQEWYYEEEGISVYDVIMPAFVKGELIGAVSMGFSMEKVNSIVNRNLMMIIAFGALFFVILGTIMFNLSNYVVRTLNKAKAQLNLIASGDLTGKISLEDLNKKDEFGEINNALQDMQTSLEEMLKNISDTSHQVASSSEELTAISQQSAIAAEEVARTIEEIAKGASEQAKDTEKGATHINELGGLIEKDQQYVKNLNNSTDEVNKLKDEGFQILKDLVEKNKLSNKAANEVHEIIININESSEKIESASQMIRNISEQTNLLALNAAIEAARAGEAGRGFAVVADEIRKLAEQSNGFTEEIATVIQELTSKTGDAVNTMNEVGKIVTYQTESVEATNTKFEGISDAIERMQQVIADINRSGKGMEAKKNEIIDIIQNLSGISEENAAGTEEASASVEEQTASMEEISNASEALSKLAEEMQNSITKFRY
ncbi:methyl-accepting chemotaxis protein [Anaerovirgula multivorans]|uniref:Methyl-accepting chemotaxis protein n=1 Tax=Anaerovirgula multivorans TaxID=312168 RepID=A0A239JNQ4_9FIRM|nr:methyl-accepting chemotaxis protein [Anaerovirgula multivorans]SNT07172.1 methyl-accepting chemotaxis protein [Anaerovirgula multivorans]